MLSDTNVKPDRQDKILGMIYGNIFGNIIGGYSDLMPTPYIRNILEVLSQITNDNMSISVTNISKKLQDIAMGTTQTIQTNEYLGVASMLGSLSSAASSEQSTAELAARISLEPQFITSFIAQTAIVFYLIYNDLQEENDIDRLLFSTIEISRKYLAMKAVAVDGKIYWKKHNGAHLNNEFSRQVRAAFIGLSSELHLESAAAINCFCCSVYALQVIKIMMKNKKNINFSKAMLLIKNHGGQSDINCAMIGGVLGAYVGYSKLSSKYPPIAPDDAEVIARYVKISAMPPPLTPAELDPVPDPTPAAVDSIEEIERLEEVPCEKND